jgi:hypothetical protein
MDTREASVSLRAGFIGLKENRNPPGCASPAQLVI